MHGANLGSLLGMDACRCSDPDSVQLKPVVHNRYCGLEAREQSFNLR